MQHRSLTACTILAIAAAAGAQDTVIDTAGFEGFAIGALDGQNGWNATTPGTGVPGTTIVDGDALGIGGGQVMKLEVADVQNSTDVPTRQAFWGDRATRPAGSLGEASINFPTDLYNDQAPGGGFYDWAIVEFKMYKPRDGWDSNVWMYLLDGDPAAFEFRGYRSAGIIIIYDQFQGDSKESTNPGVGDDLFNINGQWSRGDFPNDNNHPGEALFCSSIDGAWPQWWELAHDDWFTVQLVFLFDFDNDGDLNPDATIQHDVFIEHPTAVAERGDRGNIDGPYSYFDQSGDLPVPFAPNTDGAAMDGFAFQLSKDDATPGQPDTYYIDDFRVTAGTGTPPDGFSNCLADYNRDGSIDDNDVVEFNADVQAGEWSTDVTVDLSLDYFDSARQLDATSTLDGCAFPLR